MEHFNKTFCLEVKGDYACFTRPEMKVERVSYDVITPSSARGIFEAIFWKPAIRWRIRKIEILNPIKWISVRRNEVGQTASDRSEGIFIETARQQRAGLFLRDVAYRLYAELEFIPHPNRTETKRSVPEPLLDTWEKEEFRKDENPGKYYGIFERRARKGQCFNQPYLGCREFSCEFRLIDGHTTETVPISETRDLGFMLYDLDFEKNVKESSPAFFRCCMEQGVINVPAWDSEEVRK
ncbi:type I-C CRISPR-associated protein Cas5c [Pelodictyon luteolum]|uniref:pre-crRNA processing endonuclease n=1 Tax=Chlorobium luteolum (strain DSM 273 / BCRC 81028 / 2530) TaxID=319225 RepID=Q3B3C5_CHLL3|nr:type I-C CRISPR-associated protein Cas5c [Pelodictyon luteolum]ABB24156.1 CRISPR-associated protein, Csd5d family [Pelodictyon luteolum DSM 273]